MTATPQAASDLSASPVSPSAGGSGGQSHRSGGLRPARPLLTYLWLDLYRSLREPANLFFVVAFPLAMYLVFGRLNASAGDYGPHAHGNVSASVMLAMAPSAPVWVPRVPRRRPLSSSLRAGAGRWRSPPGT